MAIKQKCKRPRTMGWMTRSLNGQKTRILEDTKIKFENLQNKSPEDWKTGLGKTRPDNQKHKRLEVQKTTGLENQIAPRREDQKSLNRYIDSLEDQTRAEYHMAVSVNTRVETIRQKIREETYTTVTVTLDFHHY